MWIMAMLRYFKRTNSQDGIALPSVVPSSSGKDVQQLSDGVKHSMEQIGTEEKHANYNDYMAKDRAQWEGLPWKTFCGIQRSSENHLFPVTVHRMAPFFCRKRAHAADIFLGTRRTTVPVLLSKTRTAYGPCRLPSSHLHSNSSLIVSDKNNLEVWCPRTQLLIVNAMARSVNEARKVLFTQKGRAIDAVSPTQTVLFQQI